MTRLFAKWQRRRDASVIGALMVLVSNPALMLATGVQMVAGSAAALEIGDAAPPLAAPQPNGAKFALELLRGQIVYVDFWASWCGPCLQAMPALDDLYARYREQGFIVLAVNVDRERRAAQRMLDRVGVSYPVVLDPQGTWPTAFALRGMPSGYLLDRRGIVRYIKTGYRASDLPAIEAQIRRALAETH